MKKKIWKEISDFSDYVFKVTILGTAAYWGIKAVKFIADDID